MIKIVAGFHVNLLEVLVMLGVNPNNTFLLVFTISEN